ncbi:LPS export ABC transporter periplasmic protein LptC [Desulfosarcina sp.]|uniref:LPS export ABC transporter periplasmic protein LptC n=1 Tax=Desulfosarcina sp. TaxID=2027861 RepID=UPI003970A68D
MKKKRLVQRILLAVGVLALGTTIAVFIGYRHVTRNPEILLDRVQKEADMQLNKIRQTATKNGIREWRLEAESATLMDQHKTMLLTRPDVEFFMDDGDNVRLTADRGTIFTDSSRMNISGQVSADTSLYRFRTDALAYDPATRELRADTPVTITGQAFTLRADSMAMNLKTNITHFEGGVEGTISEDLQL